MRKVLIIIVTQLLAFGSFGQDLDSYVNFALANNPRMKAAYSEFEASMQQVAQVNALPDPTLPSKV